MKHPIVGEYYLLDDILVEVREIITKEVVIYQKLPKKYFWNTQNYEDTGKTKTEINEIWWWRVGDTIRGPGKSSLWTNARAAGWDWTEMHNNAAGLIHQARIIHNLHPEE